MTSTEGILLEPTKNELAGYNTNNSEATTGNLNSIAMETKSDDTKAFMENYFNPDNKNKTALLRFNEDKRTEEGTEQVDDAFYNKPSLFSKILKTISIDAAYFGAALSLGIIGPSLIDLEAQTNTTGAQIATIFTLRGVLAIIASLLLAPVLEIFNRYMSVGISLFFTGVLTLLAPVSNSFATILLALGPPELFGCALGMGTHLLCVEIWRAQAGPFLQLLNFVSIAGFAVAPLIVKPFLSESIVSHIIHNMSLTDCTGTTHRNVTLDVDTNTARGANYTMLQPSITNPCLAINITNTTITTEGESRVYVAYVIVGTYCLLAALIFVMIIYFDSANRGLIRKIMPLEEHTKSNHTYSNSYLIFLYIQFYLLILFYGGIEVGFCGLVPTFAVRELKWSKGTGALLVTVVQGFNAVFTLLGIFLSNFVRPKLIILIDVNIVVVSLLVLDLFVATYPNIMWFCCALLGIGSASIMPSAYTWANDTFEITGVFNGFYWCGFFSGFMLMPAITGYLMETYDHMWFCHVFLICSVLLVLLFGILVCSVNKKWVKLNKEDIIQMTIKSDI